MEKCLFGQPYVEYLGHLLSSEGIAKAPKHVDAIMKMPAPKDVSTLRSFLGSIQFHAKFLSNLSTKLEPLYHLTKKNVAWKWTKDEQKAFEAAKVMLCEDTVLVHFDPTMQVGIASNASEVGIGAVLFHRYPDGSEHQIYNMSKTLTETQRKYGQIQKEALAIIFALNKFHQYLYGRKFILVTDHKPLLALFGPKKPTPALAANRLARWALLLNQYDYLVEYRKTKNHGNADALSHLPVGEDKEFDGEESAADADMICTVHTIGAQISPTDPGVMAKESAKDPVLAQVMQNTQEGWPAQTREAIEEGYTVEAFRKLQNSLSISGGCLFHGIRLVVPASLQPKVLEILHLGHFGMQKMKQLARTAVYWPGIDAKIMEICRTCLSCAEQQNKPAKAPIYPWMLPEKPWSHLHLDHAVNFMGSNWLVVVDAYSKYPCIHSTTSISTQATISLLEEDFAHFGYPHAIVTDNVTAFTSAEFKDWCRSRGITHLTGAPYHPATNGAAERLVQTFKNALKKSRLPPRKAVVEFLMQYRRTPTTSGLSPSELLNGRQICALIDALAPSVVHQAQGRQSQQVANSMQRLMARKEGIPTYKVGTPCYALYCGPCKDKDSRWIPVVVTKVYGAQTVNVRVVPHGPTWR